LLRRNGLLQSPTIGDTQPGERTAVAGRRGRRADECAEFHQRLVEVAGPLLREHGFSRRPDPRLPRSLTRIATIAEETRQNAQAISFNNREWTVKCLRQDRAQNVSANAGQGGPDLRVVRKFATVVRDELLRGHVQVAGAAIVAESFPEL